MLMASTPPRILIVDDREQNRYVLTRILQQAGYSCDEAATGREALAKIQSLPDVAILDVHLPDLSGFELCRKIKSNPRTAIVSVLQISASFVTGEDKARALDAGADAYLIHPIDSVVLVATVGSLLRLRRAEAAARQASLHWQSTFDSLAEGLAFIDLDGNITQWNQAFEGFCGSPLGQSAAKTLTGCFGDQVGRLAESEGQSSAELQLGSRTVQLTMGAVTADDNEIGKLIILSDVTDHKLAEYAMRTAEKLAATGKLANAIAHEINNPLEALTNLLYLAQSVTSPDHVREYLERANEEVARISRITKQSLSFHRDTQHPVALDLGCLLADVVALYEKWAATRCVRLVLKRETTPAVHGFPGQLMQVFGNLVRNATEASPSESEVVIRVRQAVRNEREGTRVTIHDRGAGIPPAVQRQIFDPFFTTKELKGSGLGLWVSRTLILNHHGNIRFRSCTGTARSGTTFQVFLPALA